MAKQAPFGSYIREKRVEEDVSMRQAAKHIGVSHVYLSKVERGKVGPLAEKYWDDLLELVPSLDRNKLRFLAQISGPIEFDIEGADSLEKRAVVAFKRKLKNDDLPREKLEEYLDEWQD